MESDVLWDYFILARSRSSSIAKMKLEIMLPIVFYINFNHIILPFMTCLSGARKPRNEYHPLSL